MNQHSSTIYDVLVVGGGINGCGIARDLAGRGLKVVLIEKGDLASGTSSGSTKLIHGGLRYLEHYAFGLVRAALKEREVLLKSAPHIVWPLRFVLPHRPQMRPAWLVRLGLRLYDLLGGRKELPPTSTINLSRHPAGEVLKDDFGLAYVYSDCWVDDARLVILNAIDAARLGANIRTHTKLTKCRWLNGLWSASILDNRNCEGEILARIVVNAAGPFADDVARMIGMNSPVPKLRRVQGTHIVVPKLFCHDLCYTLQHRDGRVLFTIPYEESFTLVGTTDFEPDETNNSIVPSAGEISYLVEAINENFSTKISETDIVWAFSALRPLVPSSKKKAHQASRDYSVKIADSLTHGRSVHVLGGKLTTYRILSENVGEKVARMQGITIPSWTAGTPLPGGDLPFKGKDEWRQRMVKRFSFLPEACLARLLRLYGTMIELVLKDAESLDDMGPHLGLGLYVKEVNYLLKHEWAQTAEDILWRRTKLGLHDYDGSLRRSLSAYIAEYSGLALPSLEGQPKSN